MNIELNPGQTNTRSGDLTLYGSVNLTGCENLLWKIVNNNGTPNFALPTAISDVAPFVGASGDVAGNQSAAESPALNENCRVLLDGTCNPGQQLALSTVNWGRLAVPAAGYGTGYYTHIAEEAGVAGQTVKCRRVADRVFTL